MAWNALIRFDQTRETHFYLCRKCQTHIALHQEFDPTLSLHLGHHLANKNQGAILKEVVNVLTYGPCKHRKVHVFTVSNAVCKKCYNQLGFKLIDAGKTDGLTAGTFFLTLDKLLEWDGNVIMYPDSHGLFPEELIVSSSSGTSKKSK